MSFLADNSSIERRPVPGYEDYYEITRRGDVYSKRLGRFIKQRERLHRTLFIEFHPQYIEKLPGCSLDTTMEMLKEFGFQMEYATATGRDGGSLEFRKASIADFLSDDRVSMDDVFFAFLKKTTSS